MAADVTRIHSLYYEDEDVMQAVFDRDQAAHYIFSRPGMLSRLADHMRGVEEVSLIADPMRITLQSYNNLGDASTGASRAGRGWLVHNHRAALLSAATNADGWPPAHLHLQCTAPSRRV